jgi:hypothetical protein
VLSAVTTFSACLRRQVVYLVCGSILSMCVCVREVLVCGMFGCELTTKHPTEKYIRHAQTHRQNTATYQINNLTTQTSREVVTALSTRDGPLKMVKQL